MSERQKEHTPKPECALSNIQEELFLFSLLGLLFLSVHTAELNLGQETVGQSLEYAEAYDDGDGLVDEVHEELRNKLAGENAPAGNTLDSCRIQRSGDGTEVAAVDQHGNAGAADAAHKSKPESAEQGLSEVQEHLSLAEESSRETKGNAQRSIEQCGGAGDGIQHIGDQSVDGAGDSAAKSADYDGSDGIQVYGKTKKDRDLSANEVDSNTDRDQEQSELVDFLLVAHFYPPG